MRYLFILILFCAELSCFSQAPKLINYQGLARDVTGAPITSTNIALKFEIQQNTTVVFTETVSVSTNSLGLFSTQIGSGQGSNLNIDWQSGSYSLQVSIAIGTGNFTQIGSAQQLSSVPYALHAASVPASYANSVLTIGTNTIALPTSPTPTVTGAGLATVSPTTGTSFTVTVPAPTLAIASNSLSISGGNSVPLPAALPQSTLTASGIAQVSSAGTNSFNVSVPAPTLSFSSSNNNLSINNGNSISLPFFPQGSVTANSGIAVITSPGTNTFNVNVPAPVLSVSNNTLLSISGGNSVPLPVSLTPTLTGIGIASVATSAPNYTVNVPLPTYNGTLLTFGPAANTVVVAPTLVLSGTTLSSGPGSNSVNLSATGPFRQTSAGTVSLTTITDNISLGTPGLPTAKLDIRGTTTNSAVIRAVNANSSNSVAAIDVSTDGSIGLAVANTNASGAGGSFQTLDGQALYAQSSGSSTNTFYASNTSTAISTFAGYFKGGFVSESKSATSTHFALQARNLSNLLFVVRGDGNVGINTTTPSQKLEVVGSVKITDGSEADGKVLISDGTGKATWKSSPPAASFGNLNQSSVIVTSVATPLAAGTMVFTKQSASSEMDISLYSRIYAGTFSGSVTAVSFELYVDGAASTSASASHPILISGNTEFVILRSVFSGLAAGSHTITIVAKANNSTGTASGVFADPGGLGGKIIVKEIY